MLPLPHICTHPQASAALRARAPIPPQYENSSVATIFTAIQVTAFIG
jgi:hypothetical protein